MVLDHAVRQEPMSADRALAADLDVHPLYAVHRLSHPSYDARRHPPPNR